MSTFIDISRKRSYSPSRSFIRLFTSPYKRQGKAGNGVRKNAVGFVLKRIACEENNHGLKISDTKIYWKIAGVNEKKKKIKEK